MIPNIRLYLEGAGALLLVGILAGWWFDHNHKEQAIGAQRIETQDTQSTAAAEQHAEAETEANVVNAALAAKGASSAQLSVDAYLAAHPVGDIRMPDNPNDRGAGVCAASPARAGAQGTRAGSAVVRPVLDRSEGPDLGPAITEILSSASRLAVIDAERQQR